MTTDQAHTYRWKGRFGPFDLELSEHTFQPSTVSALLAEVMEVEEGATVIDTGCGSGVLAIVAAKLGAGRVIGADMAADTAELAARNAERHGVSDVTEFYQGDLFHPLPEGTRADLVIGDVSGVPDSIAAASGWFPGTRGGGPRGSELPIRMLENAVDVLQPGGRLLLPTGTLQDEAAILRRARELYGEPTKLIERNIPLPAALAESEAVRALAEDNVVELSTRGSRWLWTARVWSCAPRS